MSSIFPWDGQEIFENLRTEKKTQKNRKMFQKKFIVNSEWGISHKSFLFHQWHPLNPEIQYINEK